MNHQYSSKALWTLFFAILTIHLIAQNEIKGRVLDHKTGTPLAFASVYFNNTTLGNFTNEQGYFSLPYNPNYSELIVSYLGYETLSHTVKESTVNQFITFRPTEIPEFIAAVTISSTRTDHWKKLYTIFTDNLIGAGSFANNTKIINPEVISFNSSGSTSQFEAFAREPIIIINEALGYKLEYALVKFKYDGLSEEFVYAGKPKFTKLEGSNSKQKRWERRRKEAYNGSFLHFMRAIKSDKLYSEGFQVFEVCRHANPDRPDQNVIDGLIQSTNTITLPNNGLAVPKTGTPNNIIAKANLPRHIDSLDTSPLDPMIFIEESESGMSLQFQDYWQIQYRKELQDYKYRIKARLKLSNNNAPQKSLISLLKEEVIFDDHQILLDPLAVRFEGYWAFEKLPYLLPFDYLIDTAMD